MRRSRIQGSKSAARQRRGQSHRQLSSPPTEKKFDRFIGISLGGGKNDRTSVVIVDFFPAHKRLFLREIQESIGSDDRVSGDEKLVQFLLNHHLNLKDWALDVALTQPQCLACHLKCPGIEKCHEPHIKWFWKHFKDRKKNNKKSRLFTPYTERCVDYWLSGGLEEKFYPEAAMGSNMAPLLARARFVLRRLRWRKKPLEVYVPAAIWRIGKYLGVAEKNLRTQTRSLEKDSCRAEFLNALLKKESVFIYQQDIQKLVDNPYSFDAFICAWTIYLKSQKKVEKPPRGFPSTESFPLIPKF